MKLVYNLIITITLSSLLFNCSSNKNLYQINCVSEENQGYVEFSISNKNNLIDVELTSKKTMKTLLFSGYTSIQCQTQKSILINNDEVENFKKIESQFFSKKGVWKTFVQENLNPQKINTILINKDMLKKYLVDQKIIKPLNSRF
jgi:hypothetical protein